LACVAARVAGLKSASWDYLPVLVCAAILSLSSCSQLVGPAALVLTQSPLTSFPPGHDLLDSQYPAGTRITLAEAPFDPKRIRVLSRGLMAAGSPVVSYDGQWVIFSGKKTRKDDWQIYEAQLPNGSPHAITSIRGGAMQPALLPDGSVVFASPVPKTGAPGTPPGPTQLYKQSSGAAPRQLTFGSYSASDPTVLSDGRILFVSSQPSADNLTARGQALYTINNDGTELTPFAGQHEPASIIVRPRQLTDGRVAFLSRSLLSDDAPSHGTFQFVRMARPFFGEKELFPNATCHVISVQPASNGDLLVCAQTSLNPSSAHCPSSVFRVPGLVAEQSQVGLISTDRTAGELGSNSLNLATTVFSDPDWKLLEAAEALPHSRPMGRLSNTDLAKQTGQILCLNANDTTVGRTTNETAPAAAKIRVLAGSRAGALGVLGEVPVQPDGSFMAEVPADVPLGFEALDEQGRVLRRVAPVVWVRPGENRSCIGCHEPHNRSPHNQRPLAVRAPVPFLGGNTKGNGPEVSETTKHRASVSILPSGGAEIHSGT
jgi:hypothetical protein